MASGTRSAAARFIRRVSAAHLADGDLLRRFTIGRDQAAFAELVRRHGPMVLGVCRRVAGDGHDAEDAFQAAFLVLARKAGAVGEPGRLGNWLYGVACRTALRARAAAARRRKREGPLVDVPATDRPCPAEAADLRRVLDEEIARLPDRFRAPVVLCYLEGRTNAEAARLLGCPTGTVLSRLATARAKLRARLTRRGVALGVAGLTAAALAEGAAPAAVSPALVESTARSAPAFGAGGTAAGAVPAAGIALAEGVSRAMIVN